MYCKFIIYFLDYKNLFRIYRNNNTPYKQYLLYLLWYLIEKNWYHGNLISWHKIMKTDIWITVVEINIDIS